MERWAVWDSIKERLAQADWVLLLATGILALIGLAQIASATQQMKQADQYIANQALCLFLGICCFMATLRLDYRELLRWSPFLYVLALLLLFAVLFTRPINGARSWFNLGYFNLQPAELFKPILVLVLAHYLMFNDSYKRLSGLMIPLVLWLVPMALILRQPDLGTAMSLIPVIFAMLFVAGAKLKHLGLVVLCGCAGLVCMWHTVMHTYQKRRILAWLNPEQYEQSTAWQMIHSIMAIGSGGTWGKGWGVSVESGTRHLPEKHTDFIFSVIGEEGGFVFSALLVLMYYLIGIAGLRIAAKTREPAARLIAIGIGVLIFSQALVNLGVTLGLLPTTGVTLPFVSYGRSSLIASFIALGILVNVGSRRTISLGPDHFSRKEPMHQRSTAVHFRSLIQSRS